MKCPVKEWKKNNFIKCISNRVCVKWNYRKKKEMIYMFMYIIKKTEEVKWTFEYKYLNIFWKLNYYHY